MSPRRSAEAMGSAVVSLIGTRGPMSRSEIARRLGVSAATVTNATKRLILSGALMETGTVPSDGGRPATLLDITSNPRTALGVKITPNHLTMAAVDLVGTPLPATSVDCDMRSPDAMDRIVAAVGEMVTNQPSLSGIGLALPGFAAPEDPLLVTAPTLGWRRVPLGHALVERTGLRVVIDNDVNALAIADQLYGEARSDSPVLVTIGFGIGCAVMVDGRVVRGANGGAGELGHVLVNPEGVTCACGLRGCLETIIGDDALVRRAKEAGILTEEQGKVRLNRLANAGHPGARQLFRSAGQSLGRAVANLVHMLDPDSITISGEGVDMWHHWSEGFDAALSVHLPVQRRQISVVTHSWTEATWAHGAASLVFSLPLRQ